MNINKKGTLSVDSTLTILIVFAVANLLTRVDMDTDDAGDANTSPQLTQLAVELLTGSLTQPGVEGHSQGIILIAMMVCFSVATLSAVPMLLLSNTELIHRVALLSSPTQVYYRNIILIHTLMTVFVCILCTSLAWGICM